MKRNKKAPAMAGAFFSPSEFDRRESDDRFLTHERQKKHRDFQSFCTSQCRFLPKEPRSFNRTNKQQPLVDVEAVNLCN
jgi:hypothetical protein